MQLNVDSITLEYDSSENLLYQDGFPVQPSYRRVNEMSKVLFNGKFIDEHNRQDTLYTMFRDVNSGDFRPLFEKQNLRYDITVLENYDLGGELNKTLGHYHPRVPGLNSCYPELYEVLEGEVTFLLQKPLEDGQFDVKLIDAKRNDKVIMEPGYGHISINRGKGKLVLANLVSPAFSSYYVPVMEKKGGAYYILKNGELVPNSTYGTQKYTRRQAVGLNWIEPNTSIYDKFLIEPGKFGFLNNPDLLQTL